MSTEEKFKSACDELRKFTKRPPDSDMLELYGLYKQGTVGDINIAKPSGGGNAKLKWDAWNGRKGLNANTAQEQYVVKVKGLAGSFK